MMKKPTARASTKYGPMLHPLRRRVKSPTCFVAKSYRTGSVRDDLETCDRQQELLVLVDAAVARAARQQHCLRRSLHSALYRQQGRQGAHTELHALGQGAGVDRWGHHGLGLACD